MIEANAEVNVDAQEIAKFDRIANRWWDASGDFKPLHQLNPVRSNFIDLHAQVAEKRLLDVGCGGGLLSEAMASRGAIVTGIDMAEEPLSVARLHAKESQLDIEYLQSTVEALAEERPTRYDVITCLEMIEHVPDPVSIIHSCQKLLKPGGHLFISTLNRTAKGYALGVLAAEYILQWLPKGTHDYKKFIRPSELAAWARNEGLALQHLVGMVYNPLQKNFSISENDIDVNYIAHFLKPE